MVRVPELHCFYEHERFSFSFANKADSDYSVAITPDSTMLVNFCSQDRGQSLLIILIPYRRS